MKVANLPEVIQISKDLDFTKYQLDKLRKLNEPSKTAWTIQGNDRGNSVVIPTKLKEMISTEINKLYLSQIEQYNETLSTL
jgi:hypothetical protein